MGIHYTFVITNSAEQVNVLCDIEISLYKVCNKIQYEEILKFGTRKSTTIMRFSYISLLNNKIFLFCMLGIKERV